MYRWFRDNGLLGGFKILCLSCNDSKSTSERCMPALQGSQSNEKDGYMTKSDIIGTEGEITAIYRGGVRHAEV
jgi:hypothetical protein